MLTYVTVFLVKIVDTTLMHLTRHILLFEKCFSTHLFKIKNKHAKLEFARAPSPNKQTNKHDQSPPELVDARQRLERIRIVLLGARQANADFAGIIRGCRRVLFAN